MVNSEKKHIIASAELPFLVLFGFLFHFLQQKLKYDCL